MGYRDLREWLALVEELGELKRLSEVELNDELGALFELSRTSPSKPVLLCDDIPGYPKGHRLAAMSVHPQASARQLALTMGLPQDVGLLQQTDTLRHMLANLPRIAPKLVEDGPVLENVLMGERVNMCDFPAPQWHELDGGRYIGTADLVITRDPDEDWVNLGTYRVELHDRDTLGFYISPGKHGRIHREKYYARNEPCPVAVSFGHDPLLVMVSGAAMPWGVSEYEYAGGIKGEPIEVVKGPITGLPIPAHAELVIEGESVPGETRIEGPFGEYAGYYSSGARQEPVIKVKSILHRNNPIICGQAPIRPIGGALPHLWRAAVLWNSLERAGIPDIVGVAAYMTFFITVVSIRQRYPGHAKQVAALASQLPGGAYSCRWVIVVDDDIDPTNFDEVLWALAVRCDPEISINILNRCWSTPLDPMSRTGLAPDGPRNLNSRALVDACIPYELKSRKVFPPPVGASKPLREKVKAKYPEVLQ